MDRGQSLSEQPEQQWFAASTVDFGTLRIIAKPQPPALVLSTCRTQEHFCAGWRKQQTHHPLHTSERRSSYCIITLAAWLELLGRDPQGHGAVTGPSLAKPAPRHPEPSPLPEAPAHAPSPSLRSSSLHPSPAASHWGGPGPHSPLTEVPGSTRALQSLTGEGPGPRAPSSRAYVPPEPRSRNYVQSRPCRPRMENNQA